MTSAESAAPPPTRISATTLVVRAVIAVVGAWLVLRASWSASSLGTAERRWAALAVVLLWFALVWALPALRRLLPRPGDVPLLLCAVAAISFLCIPETDQIPRVALVAVVVTIAEAVSRRRLPLALLALVTAYVMWAGVFGATGRQSALVGTLAAWWTLLLLPLLARWRPGIVRASLWSRGAIVAVGGAATAVVARTGALEPTIGPALVAVAVALPASLVVAGMIAWASARRVTRRETGRETGRELSDTP